MEPDNSSFGSITAHAKGVEASTDDLTDFVDAQPMSAATRYTYVANLRAFYG